MKIKMARYICENSVISKLIEIDLSVLELLHAYSQTGGRGDLNRPHEDANARNKHRFKFPNVATKVKYLHVTFHRVSVD
jgi:hypothetical protein